MKVLFKEIRYILDSKQRVGNHTEHEFFKVLFGHCITKINIFQSSIQLISDYGDFLTICNDNITITSIDFKNDAVSIEMRSSVLKNNAKITINNSIETKIHIRKELEAKHFE